MNRNQKAEVEAKAEVFCVRCQGSGVNSRLNGANCIACRGKGYMDSDDQVRNALFMTTQHEKAERQRLENLKRFKPTLYQAVMASMAKKTA